MKTQEQKQQEAKAYIAKSAQHLFVINEKTFYKVISFTRDGQLHYATLVIAGENVSINVINTNRYKWEFKQNLFPQYVKTKSIPYFKAMRELVALVEAEISLTDNKALVEKIKEKVKTLELVKQ
jgi:hypothetical protein